MSKLHLLSLTSSLAAAALLACGGGQPEAASPTPAPTGTVVPSGSAQPPPADAQAKAPDAWSDSLSKEQKAAFMRTHVVPRMSKVFAAMPEEEHHEDFGCKTCHGADWKSPKDHLPKLTVKNGKLTAFADEPAVAKFMAEKVVPEMAAVMGQKPFDAATNQGFGCAGCHGIETK